ncbi:MAG TPA: twin-arginine translocation signal domain-containing protein [Nitrospira sp.]|nr:twin-arginine translocation signal domain-containing protein [Nitrospira sp.]
MISRREFLLQTTAGGVVAVTSSPVVHAAKAIAGNDGPKLAGADVVETVLGPIDVSKLGFTLSHEHVCYIPMGLFSDRTAAADRMVDKLMAAKADGIDTIIDLTPFDGARDVRFGQEVSRRSGMQIVVATGFRFPHQSYLDQTVEQIAEVYIREIEQGIEDTGVKAGVIKVASQSGTVLPAEEKGIKAAVRASKATGVPIETHTDARHRGGEAQAAIFEAEGINPARVSMGHCDDTEDVNYLIALAKRGSTLGIDHVFYGAIKPAKDQPDYVQYELQVPWKKRAGYVKQLIDAGFGDKIFLSNDWELEREEFNPDGFLFNTRKTIPYLKQLGVSEREIHAITVDNPRRFFGRD